MLKVLGAFIMALPFIGLFGLVVLMNGWLTLLIFLGGLLVLAGLLCLGAFLWTAG